MLGVAEALPTIDRVVGANLKRIRESLNLTQAQAARRFAEQGLLFWNRDTQASVETARRSLNLEEAFIVVRSLGVSLADLLSGEGVVFIEPDLLDARGKPLGDVLPRALKEVRARLAGGKDLELIRSLPDVRVRPLSRRQTERFLARAALDRVAKRFHRSKASIDKIAKRTWGHGLEDEYVKRVLKKVRKDSSPRSVAAIRAATMRSLYAELGRALKEK